jgi:predicted metalloprotease with PDZ domain
MAAGSVMGGENKEPVTAASSANPSSNPSMIRDRGNQDAASKHDDAEHQAALGVTLSDASGGVRVTSVVPGSPAANIGLRVGDEIRSVDGQQVGSTQGLIDGIRAHRPGSQAELAIVRNGERQTFKATLSSRGATFGNRPAQASRYYTMRPTGAPMNEQQLRQQVQSLRQEINRLQQHVDQLQPRVWTGAREWSSKQRHGEGNTDPALFQ